MENHSVTYSTNDDDRNTEAQIDERQLAPALSEASILHEDSISVSDYSSSDDSEAASDDTEGSNDEVVYIFDGFSITPQNLPSASETDKTDNLSQLNANPTNKKLYSGNTTFQYEHETPNATTQQTLSPRSKDRSHQSDLSTELDTFLHKREANFHFVMFAGINEKMSRFTLRFQNDELEKQYFLTCFRTASKNSSITMLCGVFFVIYAILFLVGGYPWWMFLMFLIDSIWFFAMGVLSMLIRRRQRNWIHYYSFKWGLALNSMAVGLSLAFVDGWGVRHYRRDQIVGIGVVCYFVVNLISFDYPYKLRQIPAALTMIVEVVCCLMAMMLNGEYYKGVVLNLVGTALVCLLTLSVGYLQEFNKRQTMLFQLYLQKERAKSEELLFNMLPAPVVDQLKEMSAGESHPLSPEASNMSVAKGANVDAQTPKTDLQTPKPELQTLPRTKTQESVSHTPIKSYTQHTIAEYYEEVSVLFCEITRFSKLASVLSPEQLVGLLNDVYSIFDQLTEKHGVYKIENIGPVYVVAGGCPVPSTDHAQRLSLLAVDMMKYSQSVGARNLNFGLKIGINTGPVRAGVVGTKSLSFKLFGDTVNTAARMESYSQEGRITLSPITRQRLLDTNDGTVEFITEDRGLINVKGKGDMNLYFLNDVQGAEGVYLSKTTKLTDADKIASLYESLETPMPLSPVTLKYKDKTFAEHHPTCFATFVTPASFTFLQKFVGVIIIFEIYAANLLEDDTPGQVVTAAARGLSMLSVVLLLIITINFSFLRKVVTKSFQFIMTDLYVILVVCETISCILTKRDDIYLFMMAVIVPLIHAVPGYDYRFSAVVTFANWFVFMAVYPVFTDGWFVVTAAAVTLVNAVSAALSYSRCYNERMNYYLNDLVESERRQSDAMLTSMLPAPVVQRLKNGATAICDEFHSVSILYSDIVSFTNMASKMDPKDLVVLLNQIYTAFDYLTEKHKVFKLEIIGDSYTAVSGIDKTESQYNHAKATVLLALDMIQAISKLKTPQGISPIRMRFGIHTGKIVGGIVGLKKFRYHAWGSDVLIANMLESHGVPNQVVVSQETKDLLTNDAMFHFQFHQELHLGELGKVKTYIVDV